MRRVKHGAKRMLSVPADGRKNLERSVMNKRGEVITQRTTANNSQSAAFNSNKLFKEKIGKIAKGWERIS